MKTIHSLILAAAAALTVALPVTAAAATTGYGPYLTVASPSLNERAAPTTSATLVGSLPYHSTIYIVCQTSGSLVGASTVWDKITNGSYISDYWTNTPGQNTWTPSIPRCGTTVSVGRTVSYNEGTAGQCTWWAINEFHLFSGYYPNLISPYNNGDAGYWAGNAAYNGWTVSATPRAGSIAVFPPGVNQAGSVGHVGWVTGVSGSQITITEMNFVAWNSVDTRTLTPASSVRYILAP
jgi:surface antigen